MADYHQVKEGELKCSAQNDSNIVGAVYVFPDKKEIDLFSRLLQAACWYSDETPGYLLSFSHQQFFFELKDMRQQLHWKDSALLHPRTIGHQRVVHLLSRISR